MPQNGIRMDGITALAHGLAKNPGLEYIDLQDNTFTFEGELTGVQAWTDALSSWPELKTLNLSDCVLSGDGEVPLLVSKLAEGSNPKLRTLQLQNNNLEAATFELFANTIATTLQGLMSLELQWNEQEEDDEFLEAVGLTMKARGGKLVVSDEDEEEEEKEAEEEIKEEEETKEEKEAVLAEAVQPAPAPTKKDDTDELAELLGKVEIK